MIDFDMKERELNELFEKVKSEVVANEEAIKAGTEELLRIQGEFRLLSELRKTQDTTG